jgi:hypothetical protein
MHIHTYTFTLSHNYRCIYVYIHIHISISAAHQHCISHTPMNAFCCKPGMHTCTRMHKFARLCMHMHTYTHTHISQFQQLINSVFHIHLCTPFVANQACIHTNTWKNSQDCHIHTYTHTHIPQFQQLINTVFHIHI